MKHRNMVGVVLASLAAWTACVPLGGCATTPDEPEVVMIDRSWINGSWTMDLVGASGIVEVFGSARLREPVSMQIGDGRVSGYAGVNRFNAALEYTAGDSPVRFVLGPVMSTKMAGPPEAMAGEARVLGALRASTRFVAVPGDPDRMLLQDDAGAAVLSLTRVD